MSLVFWSIESSVNSSLIRPLVVLLTTSLICLTVCLRRLKLTLTGVESKFSVRVSVKDCSMENPDCTKRRFEVVRLKSWFVLSDIWADLKPEKNRKIYLKYKSLLKDLYFLFYDFKTFFFYFYYAVEENQELIIIIHKHVLSSTSNYFYVIDTRCFWKKHPWIFNSCVSMLLTIYFKIWKENQPSKASCSSPEISKTFFSSSAVSPLAPAKVMVRTELREKGERMMFESFGIAFRIFE